MEIDLWPGMNFSYRLYQHDFNLKPAAHFLAKDLSNQFEIIKVFHKVFLLKGTLIRF